MEFGGIWKKRGQVFGAPAYWALREYSSATPRYLLTVDNDSPTYSIAKGVTRLPTITGVPYLDIAAAESADHRKLLLFCVNRHLTRGMHAQLDLSQFRLQQGSVNVQSLKAESILVENDEEDPSHVVPTSTLLPSRSNLDYFFPAGSVTVMTVPLN